jgi:hypothetical protein
MKNITVPNVSDLTIEELQEFIAFISQIQQKAG